MEIQREQPPPYQSHNPEDLILPSVPQSDFTRAPSISSDITLPDLRSVLGDLPTKTVHPNVLLTAAAVKQSHNLQEAILQNGNRTLPRLDASRNSGTAPRSSIESLISPSDTASVMSIEEQSQRSTSVSLEDPDVRLAAEALSGLGKSGYGRQSTTRSSVSHSSPPASEHTSQQEPLLCLLPGRHPWVGSTINGSLSAYNVTKNYSPGFVRYGADLIERNIGTPLASTVSSVAKRTGVENGLRRYLSSGRVNQSDRTDATDHVSRADSSNDLSNKRRRVMTDSMDIERTVSENAMTDSMEDLPPYRTSKPPSYREEVSPHSDDRRADSSQMRRTQSPAMTMAGLYVAMSDASLRSLRYCVHLLVTATQHVETVMRALKLVLQDMDRQRDSRAQQGDQSKAAEAGIVLEQSYRHEQQDPAENLAHRIQQYCDDIMNTLKTVVNSVSTYAGGALPENARDYIKQQLLSVPQRWRWATQSTASSGSQESQADGGEAGESGGADGEARRSARRMIAFATEGIDMMEAVNTVIQNTCMEAERWMDTLPAFRRNKDTEMMDADEPK